MDRCDHCDSYRETAYTLTVHSEAGDRIQLDFCSSDCLRFWTGSPRVLTEPDRRTAESANARVQEIGRSSGTR